jgi:hypothetical protein
MKEIVMSGSHGGDAYKILAGKREGKRTLGRPGCGWENNIKIYIKEIGRCY